MKNCRMQTLWKESKDTNWKAYVTTNEAYMSVTECDAFIRIAQ
jgi:hypothetical protein